MHIFGLHAPSKCWIFKVFLFSILIFHRVFILSLSNQVLGSHSPFRCLVYTLQSHFFFFFLEKIIFILSLSDQVLGYLIYTLQADFRFLFLFFFVNLNFSWGFHPSRSPNRFYVLTLHFFSIWIFHDVSHLLYYHSPSRL